MKRHDEQLERSAPFIVCGLAVALILICAAGWIL